MYRTIYVQVMRTSFWPAREHLLTLGEQDVSKMLKIHIIMMFSRPYIVSSKIKYIKN